MHCPPAFLLLHSGPKSFVFFAFVFFLYVRHGTEAAKSGQSRMHTCGLTVPPCGSSISHSSPDQALFKRVSDLVIPCPYPVFRPRAVVVTLLWLQATISADVMEDTYSVGGVLVVERVSFVVKLRNISIRLIF